MYNKTEELKNKIREKNKISGRENIFKIVFFFVFLECI